MRKALSAAVLWLFAVQWLIAQQQGLPIRRIVIYKNGIAYVVRSGEIQAPLNMTFHPKEMNDVLKTFTAWNPETSVLYPVGYTTDIPSSHLLERFPFTLEDPNIGFAGFLRQVKGAAVRIDVNGHVLSGKLVALAEEQRAVQQQTLVKDERVAVLMDDGTIQNVWLSDVRSLQFDDPTLTTELRSYLNVLSEGRQDVTREMTVYPSSGRNPINVGYVQQFPVWKTSYRIDMEASEGKVQAWTQIDNPTGESWDDIELTLVSGMPVSFEMNLYEPLYTSRQFLTVPGASAAAPRDYQSAVRTASTDGAAPAPDGTAGTLYGQVRDPAGAAIPGVDISVRSLESGKILNARTDGNGNYRVNGIGSGSVEVNAGLPGFQTFRQIVRMNMGSVLNVNPRLDVADTGERIAVTAEPLEVNTESTSVVSSFQQSDVARVQDYFEYKFPFAVRLASRQSALLPFLNRTVKLERVSIYAKESDSRHPQLGAILENNSGVPFEPGPVTFFQDGRYAGETVLSYVSRGEKKLVGYGVDYDIEVVTRDHELPERIVKIKAEKGSITLQKETVRTTTYEIRNKSSERRVVLIEHPRDGDVKLSGASPEETTETFYRFRVPLNANQELRFPVKEIESDESVLSVRDLDRARFEVTFAGSEVPSALRTKLSDVIREREKLADLRKQRTPLDARITAIVDDQNRLRENLKALRETTEDRELRKKYLDQLAVQETQIAELRGTINEILRQVQEQEALVEKLIADFRWD